MDTSLGFAEGKENSVLGMDWNQSLEWTQLKVTENVIVWDFAEQRKLIRRLCRSLISVHRENAVLPDLNIILEKLSDAVEKLYTECRRIGAISSKSKCEIPASSAISVHYGAQQLTSGFQTIGKLFNSLSLFLEKYKDEPISMMSYLNMNRISKAERLLSQAFTQAQALLRLSYGIRFQSLGQVFVCAVRIREKARGKHVANLSMELPEIFEKAKPVAVKQLPPQLQTPDDSFQQGLFTKTNEERTETLWPASPIAAFNAEASVNTSIASVVAQIPKTIFTPDIALKPPKNIRI